MVREFKRRDKPCQPWALCPELELAELALESTIKMKISGKQVKAARDLLGITQAELSEATGLTRNTISNFEAGTADPYQASLDKITDELERRGIEFSNGTGVGVRLNNDKAAEFSRLQAQVRKETAR